MSQCPLKADPQRLGVGECTEEKCSWWLKGGCAVAYIGANCRSNIYRWRDTEDDVK